MKLPGVVLVLSGLLTITSGTTEIIFPDSESEEQGISIDLARKLSQVKNVDDVFDLVAPNQRSMRGPLISARFGGPVARSANIQPIPVTCQPELTTISLTPKDADSSLIYFPPCTKVYRCGLCGCYSPLLECQANNTETLHLEVNVFKSIGSSLEPLDTSISVPVEQHKDCFCGCRLKEQQCNELQRFDKSLCSCQCINKDRKDKCKGRTKRWNSKTCTCECREDPELCSSGYKYSKASCRCEKSGDDTQPAHPINFNYNSYYRTNN